MRIGIIGYGGWGRVHADVAASLKDHELVALACRSEETAAAARRDHPDVPVTTDYRTILRDDSIEAVHVVVPNHLHVPVATEALEAGKHVVLEKPMALSLEEGRRFVETVRRSGRVVSLVHELRFSEQWSAVREVVSSGRIGAPRYALLNLFRFPYRSGSQGWRYDRERVGSWVLEEPIHFFDLLLWYMEEAGPPVSLSARVRERGNGLSGEFTAQVAFAGGAYGLVNQTLSGFEHHQVVEITGENGAVRSLWSGAMDRTDKPVYSVTVREASDDNPRTIDLDEPSGEIFEIRRCLGAVLDGFAEGRAVYPVEKELELVGLCLRAEEAARSGRTIDLTKPD